MCSSCCVDGRDVGLDEGDAFLEREIGGAVGGEGGRGRGDGGGRRGGLLPGESGALLGRGAEVVLASAKRRSRIELLSDFERLATR